MSQEAFFNAVEVNGGTRGGRTCWDDPGFVADMKRRHPHIVPPKGEGGNGGERFFALTVGGGDGKPKCRYGRVKERIRFSGGRKVTERF